MSWKSTLPLSFLCFLSLVIACSPKVAEVAEAPEEPVAPAQSEPKEENLSPCPKFSDAPDPDGITDKYVIYRDYLKAQQYKQAFELWKQVYDVAPAADGRRNTVYADGIRLYEYFLSQAKNQEKKNEYIDRIFDLYDGIQNCYPEGGYIVARKAFDYYYKYPERSTKEQTYEMFKQAIDTAGMDTPDFVLNPFTSLLVELHEQGKVLDEEAQKYQQKVRDILAAGLEDCEGVACERWQIIQDYAPNLLSYFETVRGFYDCDYYIDKYYQDFLDNPKDCDILRTVYSRLKWGACPKANEKFKQLIQAGNENCVTKTEGPASIAYNCLKEADYDCAIEKFKEAAENTDDSEKQGQYLLLVAKIYQSHLKNFSRSREYANKAAEARPKWGEPYLHIGRLYASSGPLCGPGRGWASQIVVWPALDMWYKAKSVDPSAAAEANKWINRYAQYMPKKEDVFQRNLKTGDSFFVGCWIQRSTRIRTAN